MTLLQYYLFANIYILAFWICYRIWLKKLRYFKSIRIYLNSALVLSSLLPLIQFGITDLIGPTSIITTGENLPLVGIIYNYQIVETLSSPKGYSYNWTRLLELILITGSIATVLVYVYNHFRIMSLIRRSSEHLILKNRLKVSKSNDVTIPFIYNNRIVIPTIISSKEIPLVLDHETLHYQNRHHFDNMLYSILHTIFWVNPFFLMLREALKLNHEYQVDGQIISAGMDPISYKLSLIKYSAGWRKFSLANGLSSSNIKNRLMMINNNYLQKSKWRFYLLIPIISLIFTLLCIACIQSDYQEAPVETLEEAPVTNIKDDSLIVEFITISSEEVKGWNKNNVIVVLMNRSSEIMISSEKLIIQNVEQKVISEYNKINEGYNGSFAGNAPVISNAKIKIIVQRDLTASKDEYQKLLDAISTALFKLREMQSIRLFGGTFDSLTDTQQEAMAEIIPLRIYGISPKEIRQQPNPEPNI